MPRGKIEILGRGVLPFLKCFSLLFSPFFFVLVVSAAIMLEKVDLVDLNLDNNMESCGRQMWSHL